jgi:hypothetical protein
MGPREWLQPHAPAEALRQVSISAGPQTRLPPNSSITCLLGPSNDWFEAEVRGERELAHVGERRVGWRPGAGALSHARGESEVGRGTPQGAGPESCQPRDSGARKRGCLVTHWAHSRGSRDSPHRQNLSMSRDFLRQDRLWAAGARRGVGGRSGSGDAPHDLQHFWESRSAEPDVPCCFCGYQPTANRSVKSAPICRENIGAPGFEPGQRDHAGREPQCLRAFRCSEITSGLLKLEPRTEPRYGTSIRRRRASTAPPAFRSKRQPRVLTQ